MSIYFLPILIASLTTFIAINLLRPFAISINLVDKPSKRKLHAGSVPLIGGIAMFFAIVISILVFPRDHQLDHFLLASLILVVIGVLDDHKDISISLRFFFQALVAVIIVSVGDIYITSFGSLFGNGEIFLNKWSYFISVIAIISAINAVNMADGIHGLAGGNSLITFLAILFISVGNLSYQSLWITLLFCSVLPVFLMHNLCLGMSESKRIFMGDAGSMFIGMGIVWLLIDLSQGELKIFDPVIALWLFAIPLFDMVSVFLRRIASGISPFKADLFHMHHLLLHLGMKQNNVLLLILAFSLLMSIIGILGMHYEVVEWVMFSGFLIIFVIYMFTYKVIMRIIKYKVKQID
jgi:UDP-GlcNAc:undecaprenyl-phosphate/decaprenyl-phosphate GlcNAc-1-phosphate transferase